MDAIMQLPNSAQEIADVIGRGKALYLIGQLPRVYAGSANSPKSYGREGTTNKKSQRVIMYVPKRLNANDNLVRILGWHDAEKLVREFGGMLIQPANCTSVYRPHRDANIARLAAEGLPLDLIADWFDVSRKHVRNVIAEIPPQAIPQAANDNAPTVITQAHASNERPDN